MLKLKTLICHVSWPSPWGLCWTVDKDVSDGVGWAVGRGVC